MDSLTIGLIGVSLISFLVIAFNETRLYDLMARRAIIGLVLVWCLGSLFSFFIPAELQWITMTVQYLGLYLVIWKACEMPARRALIVTGLYGITVHAIALLLNFVSS